MRPLDAHSTPSRYRTLRSPKNLIDVSKHRIVHEPGPGRRRESPCFLGRGTAHRAAGRRRLDAASLSEAAEIRGVRRSVWPIDTWQFGYCNGYTVASRARRSETLEPPPTNTQQGLNR